MSKHSQYETLCALAALNEISTSEADILNSHLGECEECRLRAADYIRLQRVVLPAVNRKAEGVIESSRKGVEAAMWASMALGDENSLRHTCQDSSQRWRIASARRWNLNLLWASLAISGIVVVAFVLGTRYDHTLNRQLSTNESSVINPPLPGGLKVLRAGADQPKQISEDRAKELAAELKAEQGSVMILEKRLSADDQHLIEATSREKSLKAQSEEQSTLVASMRAELDAKQHTLEQALALQSVNETNLVALRYQVEDLSKKLNGQSASLDRERELLSHGREIRDIIGARNLHIIDVYDTDPEGMTQKPFARAFYTEGKSLIFYAYDLPARKTEDGKYVYAAWGQNNGNKDKVRNLGILLSDDNNQKRWVFNFSDPNVLAEIDSVFITLERVGFDGDHPRGKRMLTAFLSGQVNHP